MQGTIRTMAEDPTWCPDPIGLTDAQAGDLWREFGNAVGFDELKRAYDWDTPPRAPRFSETVFGVYTGSRNPVAWGSLTKHPLEHEVFLSRGVFPRYRRRGVGHTVLEFLTDYAFKRLMADVVTRVVYKRNWNGRTGLTIKTSWKMAGETWYPQPTYYLIRLSYQDWLASKT